MALTLLLGGAGSGKSRLAVRTAARWNGPVAVIVTAKARDDEMADKIRRHRAARPSDWTVVEEPLELENALSSVGEGTHVIVDCLTLWVSNLMEKGIAAREIEERARRTADAAAGRSADTTVVTNEVGSGIVPTSAVGREFREVLGRVNSVWAEAADRAALVVAGKVLPLSPPEAIAGKTDGG